MTTNLERKVNLLLRCWLSDTDNLNQEAIDTEKELIDEVKMELQNSHNRHKK